MHDFRHFFRCKKGSPTEYKFCLIPYNMGNIPSRTQTQATFARAGDVSTVTVKERDRNVRRTFSIYIFNMLTIILTRTLYRQIIIPRDRLLQERCPSFLMLSNRFCVKNSNFQRCWKTESWLYWKMFSSPKKGTDWRPKTLDFSNFSVKWNAIWLESDFMWIYSRVCLTGQFRQKSL